MNEQTILTLTPQGTTFNQDLDGERLGKQALAVWHQVRDQNWWTLRQLSDATGSPEASVSARLRDFRRLGLEVERERIGESGSFRYRVSCAVPPNV